MHPATESPAALTPTRRCVLAAASGSFLLAGCGAGTASSDATTPDATSPDATTPSAASGSAAAIVALAKVPVGGAVAAKLDGKPIIVAQPTAGTVAGFSAICTHNGCTVAPAGATLKCPCHGAEYDALTGKVTKGPAPRALDSVAVAVEGDSVVSA